MKENKGKKLLFVGNSPTVLHSGQSVVSRALCTRLLSRFDVRVAGWGYKGEKHSFPFHIYPTDFGWWKAVDDFEPDILFLSHDIWRFQPLLEVRRKYPELKVVGYFTVDGEPLPKAWIPILNCCDVVISPSVFGQKVIEERWYGPVLVVPQGVEKSFFLQEDKKSFKMRVDEESKRLAKRMKKVAMTYADKFVVFFCGMNQTKKNLGAILDGFTEFAHDKDDVFLNLVVHSHIISQFSLRSMGDYSLDDVYSWSSELSKMYIINESLSERRLRNFYGVADVLLSPSIGEGFGLFVVEAMASKVIPILTNYSAFIEWPDPRAMFLMNVDAFYRVHWNFKRAIVDSSTVADTLERAYNVWKYVPEKWKHMQEINQKRAYELTWDTCVRRLSHILDLVLKGEDFIKLDVKRLI